jgi:hypothetical protein
MGWLADPETSHESSRVNSSTSGTRNNRWTRPCAISRSPATIRTNVHTQTVPRGQRLGGPSCAAWPGLDLNCGGGPTNLTRGEVG